MKWIVEYLPSQNLIPNMSSFWQWEKRKSWVLDPEPNYVRTDSESEPWVEVSIVGWKCLPHKYKLRYSRDDNSYLPRSWRVNGFVHETEEWETIQEYPNNPFENAFEVQELDIDANKYYTKFRFQLTYSDYLHFGSIDVYCDLVEL